jgi:tetratricopeptide (TPR) repeat protein
LIRPRLRIAIALAAGVSAACSHSTSKPKASAELLLNERMAAVLLREGQAVEAERAYRDVLKDDPNNPELFDGLGSALLMQGRSKDALESFDKAVKASPKKASFRINRGLAYMELGRYRDAEADFRVADDSTNGEDHLAAAINRGRLRQLQEDYAGAEEQFTAALSRDPGSYAARLGRGIARESKKDLSGAAEDYLEAVRLQPRSADANLRLGLALLELKKGPLGCRYLRRAAEVDSGGDAGARARVAIDRNAGLCEGSASAN